MMGTPLAWALYRRVFLGNPFFSLFDLRLRSHSILKMPRLRCDLTGTACVPTAGCNTPISRYALRPVDLICFGNVKPVSPLTPVVLFAQHERGEVWASSYPEAFGNGEVTPSAWPGPGLLLRLINLWRLNAVVIQRHSCRTRSSPREKNCRIP